MPRKLAMFFTGLAITMLVICAVVLVAIAVIGINMVFTAEVPDSSEPLVGLEGSLIQLSARGILLIVMLALVGLAAFVGLWLPRRLWARFHRINPDA